MISDSSCQKALILIAITVQHLNKAYFNKVTLLKSPNLT